MATDLVMRSHRLPFELYQAAKAKAYERRESVTDVIRAALEAYVREDES